MIKTEFSYAVYFIKVIVIKHKFQTLQADISRKSHDHENLNSEGNDLIHSCDKDTDEVQDQLDDINSKWEQLSTGTHP